MKLELNDLGALLLLAVLGFTIGFGFMMFRWMLAVHRRQQPEQKVFRPLHYFFPRRTHSPSRPECWIAVRSATPEAVKLALGLNHAAPCSWEEGLAGGHEFFISPRVHGWVIITGLGLPEPGDDVDATFLFLTALSKQLGHVQYFHASRLLRHHAWARLDDGCVTRAYAWTGETVWNQGNETLPENEVGLKTFAYGDNTATFGDAEINFGKVPRLAARWSLDPAEVKLHSNRQATGIAGESALG
ncbi:MAG: hypothetical protein RL616_2669 [Verrucomicrobiota bacterium]